MSYRDGYEAGEKTGVLMVNLGTPARADFFALWRYLAEFLSDPRVVEIPRVIWRILLAVVILPLRSRRAARAYRGIWRADGSPLLVHSRALAARLAMRLGSGCAVVLGMRYGAPSIADALEALRQEKVTRIIVLPLYPQYSSAATGSVWDAVAGVMNAWRYVPRVQWISDYHDHPAYIAALADSVRAARNGDDTPFLLFSFHGLPERSVARGDPYAEQCRRTAQLLADALGLSAGRWGYAFQSRFGWAEWLKPYCLERLRELAAQGEEAVDVVCPGFAVDCLETLEEIAVENRHAFLAAGGRSLRYLPCLNDTPRHVQALVAVLADTDLPPEPAGRV